MESLRRVNLSLVVFVLICFFLPWMQVSCGGAQDTESGLDLARGGERLLWLIPLMLTIVFALGLGSDWKRRVTSFGGASVACGAMTAVLMFRERVTGDQAAGLFAVSMTGWFWVGFAAAVCIALVGLAIIHNRPPKT